MPALLLIEAHRISQRRQHRGRRMDVSPLFEAHEIVDAHTGKRGDLLATETGRAAPPGIGKPDVARCGALTTRPKEAAELPGVGNGGRSIGHRNIMPGITADMVAL
jgi:hypothetical protein